MYKSEQLAKELDFFRKTNEHFEIQAGRSTSKVKDATEQILYMAMAASMVMDYFEDGFFEDFIITDKSITGKKESQIDAYALVDTENSLVKHLHVFQFKIHESANNAASPADLLGLATYISNYFIHPTINVTEASENEALNEIREKCNEFLSARRNRKIIVSCHLITNTYGITNQNQKAIEEVMARFLSDKQLYDFSLQVYGAKEICDLINDGKIAVGEESLEILVDQEQAYRLEDNTARSGIGLPRRVIIGMCNINEFIRLQNKYHHNQLYSENIRLYLGDRGAVNKDIIRTITNTESIWFPYMNNGISIICDKLDLGSVNTTKKIRGLTLTNMQIINGCQTVNALYSAKYGEQTKDNFHASYVLVRIYEIEPQQQDFKENVIKATNNQNAVKSYSLLANDIIQIELAKIFKQFGIIYDRKGEGKYEDGVHKVISMVNAALSYRAVYLHMAKSLRSGLGKARVFQKGEYERVFDNMLLENEDNTALVQRATELYIASVVLDTIRDMIITQSDRYVKDLPIFRKSAYYLSGLVYSLNKDYYTSLSKQMVAVWIENNPAKVKGLDFWSKIEGGVKNKFEEAVKHLSELYKTTTENSVDIDNLLKSQVFAEEYEEKIKQIEI